MNKKSSLIGATMGAILVVIGFAPSAFAIAFSDFVDFGAGNSFTTINDSDSSALRSWTHDITDNIGGNPIGDITITNATLAFRYSRTDTSEHWFLNQGLGDLALTDSTDVTTNFPLGAGALADLQADGLITFTSSEDTAGADSFREFDATLSGNYTVKTNGNGNNNNVVPEPTFAALLGIGLTGLAFLRRRRSA